MVRGWRRAGAGAGTGLMVFERARDLSPPRRAVKAAQGRAGATIAPRLSAILMLW